MGVCCLTVWLVLFDFGSDLWFVVVDWLGLLCWVYLWVMDLWMECGFGCFEHNG